MPARRSAGPLLLAVLLAAPSLAVAGATVSLPPGLPDGVKRFEGRFHLLVTDLTDPEGAEVLARMEAMVREYLGRTQDFSGRLNGKLPFVLLRKEADYHNAGGPDGTAGIYDPNRQCLMAFAGKRLSAQTWHVIQHEGFHQFAASVIGGELPIWVNEGMAEYFGEGVYCGDGFVTGGIPPYRLKRVREEIEGKQLKPVADLLKMSHEAWNGEMSEVNYDQAWLMVQFLAHGEGGKYQRPFGQFMLALSRRRPWAMAWNEAFGSTEGFEDRFLAWVKALPAAPTPEVYAQAATRQLAGYASRAFAQKQTFKDVDELVTAVEHGTAKTFPADALPPGLAGDCVTLVRGFERNGVTFAFEMPTQGKRPYPVALVCTLPDGRTIRATTPTNGVHPGAGQCAVTTPKKPTTHRAL